MVAGQLILGGSAVINALTGVYQCRSNAVYVAFYSHLCLLHANSAQSEILASRDSAKIAADALIHVERQSY